MDPLPVKSTSRVTGEVIAPPACNVPPLKIRLLLLLLAFPIAALLFALSIPLEMVVGPVYVFVALRVSLDVELLWITPVTFGPMTMAIDSVPEPVPEFVSVPEWLIVVPDIVTPFAIELLLLIVKFPVPMVPPDKVSNEEPLLLLFVSVVLKAFGVSVEVLMVRADVPEVFSVMAVTFGPTPPDIVTSPEPELRFVKEPELLSGLPEIVRVQEDEH